MLNNTIRNIKPVDVPNIIITQQDLNKSSTDDNVFIEIPIKQNNELSLSKINNEIQIPITEIIKHSNETIEFDEIGNKFIINQCGLITVIMLDEILNCINNGDSTNIDIKKYIFIISQNYRNGCSEFNFISSILTQNLKMMTKIYTAVYDLSKIIEFDDIISKTSKCNNNIITFFYQFTMFMFKNTLIDNSTDSKSLIKCYSTITFFFSEIILKQTLMLRNKYNEYEDKLKENNQTIELIHKNISKIKDISESKNSIETSIQKTSDNNKSGGKKNNMDILKSVDYLSDESIFTHSLGTKKSFNTQSANENAHILTL